MPVLTSKDLSGERPLRVKWMIMKRGNGRNRGRYWGRLKGVVVEERESPLGEWLQRGSALYLPLFDLSQRGLFVWQLHIEIAFAGFERGLLLFGQLHRFLSNDHGHSFSRADTKAAP